VAIATGIVLAFALLRPRSRRQELQLATAPAGNVRTHIDIEDQAA
jgi:hypothetical protein